MRDLSSVLASADDLRVDALAQDAWCARPEELTVRETFRRARKCGYDVLPVREQDGRIRSTLATSLLESANSWQEVLPKQAPLTPDRLVARESPVFRLLDRLHEHTILFTLGPTGVDGVVTIYDVNQPAAHLFAFGVALVCETDVAETLRSVLGDDPQQALALASAALDPTSSGIRRWKRMRSADEEVHIAATLMFGEKLKLLRTHGSKRLADLHGITPDSLIADLESICALRNAIAHYDERLDDAAWTFERIRIAQRFAERTVARNGRCIADSRV
jgi:hypothetical protein